MRKIFTATLMVMGLLLGGLVSSVPAQAMTDSNPPVSFSSDPSGDVSLMAYNTVHFNARGAGAPYNIYSYKSTGRTTQAYGTTKTGVWKVCPIGYTRLAFWAPNGKSGVRGVGECIVFSLSGAYSIGTYLP